MTVQNVPHSAGPSQPNQPQEAALAFARRVYQDYTTIGSYQGPQVPLHIAPQFNRDEQRIAKAPFRYFTFAGIGDGTAGPGANLAMAGGLASGNAAVGLAGIAGSLIAQKRARDAAIPKWHELPGGELVITDYGFYMLSADGMTAVPYVRIDGALLTGWDRIELTFAADAKDAFLTPAATTVFALWCLAVYPGHPQLGILVGA
ncbi:MAG: hypothetical protein LBG60_10090 [Bifidobacteriaceae bacterium]|jgi:hypothetical protein|nr:hypothetical protein [Bifidobacteriaceae bacterium]